MLDYVYAAMWFAAALLLFFRFGKMNKIFYFAGALFLVMGGWWLAGSRICLPARWAGRSAG